MRVWTLPGRFRALVAPCFSVFAAEVALAGAPWSPASAQVPLVGPEKGALVVVGGAMASDEIYRRFIELAGGPNAPIVLIPTAAGEDEYDDSYAGMDAWREHGARNLKILHTTDRATADTEDFVEPLTKARGVFFFGGRQWRIVEAYLGTRTESELRNVLERGGVIGGTSAGASVLGSYLVRGDTETNAVIMGDHEVGFGYLRNVAVDQHVLRRNRHFDMMDLLAAHPELLGIGLDEDTAIIVRGDQFEVVGASYALIYDTLTTTGRNGTFYFLAPGDGYNLVARRAMRPFRSFGQVPNIEPRPWASNR